MWPFSKISTLRMWSAKWFDKKLQKIKMKNWEKSDYFRWLIKKVLVMVAVMRHQEIITEERLSEGL